MKGNVVNRNFTRRVGAFLLCAAAVALFQIVTAPSAFATSMLASAGAFAVLGATTVTNTGATTLNGNLGLSPGTSITGSGTITLTGTIYTPTVGTPGVAATAQSDATIAYNALAALTPTQILTGLDLGSFSTPLNAGVYKFASSAQLTGALVLDFQGLTNKNIVFQIGSTLTTASGSSVSIINAGSGDNVYWQVGSSATLGTSTSFAGDIIALTSVAMQTTAKDLCGSVIALNGAVTMDTNTISTTCPLVSGGATVGTFGSGGTTTGTTVTGTPTGVTTGTPTITGGTTVNVPEPGILLLLSAGLAGLGIVRPRLARLAPKA